MTHCEGIGIIIKKEYRKQIRCNLDNEMIITGKCLYLSNLNQITP